VDINYLHVVNGSKISHHFHTVTTTRHCYTKLTALAKLSVICHALDHRHSSAVNTSSTL